MHHLFPLSRRKSIVTCSSGGCQDLVRFFALLRIKPHAPPLVRVPVNSFEFHSRTTARWHTYCVAAAPESFAPRHLVCIVYGVDYQVSNPVCSPRFRPQRQLLSSKPPSPLVFLLISTHFTATLGIPLASPQHSTQQFPTIAGLSPRDFASDLLCRLRSLLHPVNPDNACPLRITAAAGT